MRPIAIAVKEGPESNANQKQNFNRGEHGRDIATEADGCAVNQHGHRDRAQSNQLQPAKRNVITAGEMKREVDVLERSTQKIIEKDCKTDGQRGRGGAASNCKLRPTVNESPRSAVSVAHHNVLASRARKHREKLRISQRARERKQPSHQPHCKRDARRTHVARHYPRFQKHAGADDISDVDCDRGGQAEAADKLTVGNFGILGLEVRAHFRLF